MNTKKNNKKIYIFWWINICFSFVDDSQWRQEPSSAPQQQQLPDYRQWADGTDICGKTLSQICGVSIRENLPTYTLDDKCWQNVYLWDILTTCNYKWKSVDCTVK